MKDSTKIKLDHVISLDTVYDSIPDMVLTKDKEGRITSVNHIYEKHNLMSAKDIIGKTVYELGFMSKEACDALTEDDRQVMEGVKTVISRAWRDYPDGSKVFSEMIKTPLIEDNEVKGVFVTIRDLTELKLAIDEAEKQNILLEEQAKKLDNQTKLLEDQAKQLESALESKKSFLARMSHEIRTPMNAIVGMTELALREKMSDSANEHIVTVKQAGVNLLSIINDILDFSKIESGLIDIVNKTYTLSSMLYDIISIIRMRMAYTRLRFIVSIDSKLPNTLIGDDAKLRQILINLLTNAVKYTEKGFVNLTVTGEVSDLDTLNLVFTVTDSGIGIKQEDQEKLFNEYSQVDVEKNIGIEGVGLGLAITSGLTKALGGKISIKSEYGVGSEFSIEIPQKISDFGRLAAVKKPHEKRTLIYERRDLLADALIKTIKNLGVKCDLVDNANDFLTKMSSGSYAYAIGAIELMADVKTELESLNGDFQIIGITEFGEETAGEWRTLSTPVHAISLTNLYNGVVDHYSYSTEDDLAVKFTAPDAKVLIVDDIGTNLKVAEGLLLPYEMQVDLCDGGAKSVEMVQETKYDLIFMDHRMPGVDGIEATQMIRKLDSDNDYYKNLPIVALTANAVANMREVFLNAGFNDFISKPIDTIILNTALRTWIPKEKQRRYFSIEALEVGLDGEEKLRIDGVDTDRGLRVAGGKKNLYMDILATFKDEGHDRMNKLREHRETGNLRLYTTDVHALKGALANIGAVELTELAASLEAAGDRRDEVYIEAQNDRFLAGLQRLFTSIRVALSERSREKDGLSPVVETDEAGFKEALQQLQTAIDDFDAGAMNRALDILPNVTSDEDKMDSIKQISKHILMAEFDEAEEMIKELLAG
ncbi:MAG: response regulator [Oscillospiraceae bacterium]|jgi:PAS domain S-box-containing protein|nr:response regulator [Oscillospiraceae bacterium]